MVQTKRQTNNENKKNSTATAVGGSEGLESDCQKKSTCRNDRYFLLKYIPSKVRLSGREKKENVESVSPRINGLHFVNIS